MGIFGLWAERADAIRWMAYHGSLGNACQEIRAYHAAESIHLALCEYYNCHPDFLVAPHWWPVEGLQLYP